MTSDPICIIIRIPAFKLDNYAQLPQGWSILNITPIQFDKVVKGYGPQKVNDLAIVLSITKDLVGKIPDKQVIIDLLTWKNEVKSNEKAPSVPTLKSKDK